MPSILNLKFKGNKSFVAFSNLNDTESLTKTWKVCTKVASYLEQGQRLENLSWRLWHLQNLMVDTDNAKSKREFKKLSKCMGDKLDKEKGRSIEELEAPDFKRNHSTDMIRQRAAEKERSREASQNAPGVIKRMQFTFSVDQPSQPFMTLPVKKPDTKPSAEFAKRRPGAASTSSSTAASRSNKDQEDTVMSDATAQSSSNTTSSNSQLLHFPPLFSNDFGPSALLYAAPTLTTSMNYGEGFNPTGTSSDSFSISRPTIELPLDEILFNDETGSDNGSASGDNHSTATTANAANTASTSTTTATAQSIWSSGDLSTASIVRADAPEKAASRASAERQEQQDVVMASVPSHSSSNTTTTSVSTRSAAASVAASTNEEPGAISEEEFLSPAPSTSRKASSIFKNIPPLSQSVKEILPETVAPSRVNSIYGTRSSTPTTNRPTLTLRTQNTVSTRSSGPGATATSLNPAVLRSGGPNSAPGGVKAECSNCGATHTPLWRRGLNDELNCNACGLYCKLHKRPRPKSMRNSHGEGRAQVAPRQETVDVIRHPPAAVAAQCYNCHTTATPLWRKDDEGKTVCNACGLYYKLHGSARPISMKSDVIRKRSRHDARRASQAGGSPGAPEDTPSASPGVSRRASPVRDASPTLAPDSSTAQIYDYSEDIDFRSSVAGAGTSELLNALGGMDGGQQLYQHAYVPFPGPYHPDYLMSMYGIQSDGLNFAGVGAVEGNNGGNAGGNSASSGGSGAAEPDSSMSPRSTKRRRMSTDSASEPPSSAVSFSSFSGDSYSPASSISGHSHSHSHSQSGSVSHHKRSSMEFPFSTYNSNGTINTGPALRGPGNTFWHPPMMPQGAGGAHTEDTTIFHPPMLVPATSSSSSASSSANSSASNSGNNSNGSSTSSSSVGSPNLNASANAAAGNGKDNHDSPMDFLHPPAMIQDDELFSAYLHPPMALADDGSSSSSGSGGDGQEHQAMFVDSYFQ
ncbi:hypothetical protein CVT24_001200 [Panaeolus cyanescens]|uniref:GATA-type domain-containing protein n=1 Tax=Panaeolus cyanescens TaxID=181874 RepID=A0A409VTS6_9AGAR|nr:hypothetical protein CVT24_001200 [Panaeolus cyanescens]